MLTILVPNYNRPDKLDLLIRRLFDAINRASAQKWVKICIVDDYSTADIRKVVEPHRTLNFFEFHMQSKKCGNAETAALTALEHVTTDYVWLIGNDDEVAEDSLVYLKKFLDERKYGFILLNPCIKNLDGSLSLPISSTEDVLEYDNVVNLFDDFGFVTSTTTFSCQIFRADLVREFHRNYDLTTEATVYSHTFTFFAALKDLPGAFLARPIVRFSQNDMTEEQNKLQKQSPNGSEYYHQTTGLKKLVEKTAKLTGFPIGWFMCVSEDEVDKKSAMAYGTTLGRFIFHFVICQLFSDFTIYGRIKSFSFRELGEFQALFRWDGSEIEESFDSVLAIVKSNNVPIKDKPNYLNVIVNEARERAQNTHASRPGVRRGMPKLKLYTTGRLRCFPTHAS